MKNRDRIEALLHYLHEAVIDYDGAQMAEGEQPRTPPSCRDLREISDTINQLLALYDRSRAPAGGEAKDAARWRYIRNCFTADPIYSGLIEVGLSETFTIQGSKCGVFPSCVDAAIDAARNAKEG